MQKDNALAQASTLREWSDTWQRLALAGSAEGYNEISFLLLRCSRLIEAAVGAGPYPSVPAADELPHVAPTLEMREG